MKQEEFTIFNSISSLVHMEPAVMICHCDKDNGSICLSGHYDERTRVKTIKNLLLRPQFGPTRWTGADVESAEPNERCIIFLLEDFLQDFSTRRFCRSWTTVLLKSSSSVKMIKLSLMFHDKPIKVRL